MMQLITSLLINRNLDYVVVSVDLGRTSFE